MLSLKQARKMCARQHKRNAKALYAWVTNEATFEEYKAVNQEVWRRSCLLSEAWHRANPPKICGRNITQMLSDEMWPPKLSESTGALSLTEMVASQVVLHDEVWT